MRLCGFILIEVISDFLNIIGAHLPWYHDMFEWGIGSVFSTIF